MKFIFQPMDEAKAREILAWRYEPPYDFYNAPPEELESDLAAFLDSSHHYYYVVNEEGDLIGFCYFGPDAQVMGGCYPEGPLDIGVGIKPSLTGQGLGEPFSQAVFDFARLKFQAEQLRATVAKFNHRALRLCTQLGFKVSAEFSHPINQQAFVILDRDPIEQAPLQEAT